MTRDTFEKMAKSLVEQVENLDQSAQFVDGLLETEQRDLHHYLWLATKDLNDARTEVATRDEIIKESS